MQPWRTIFPSGDGGLHYTVFALRDRDGGMRELREGFPDGEADDLNFVLFSTSGVHGHYGLIEEIKIGATADDEAFDGVTFLIVHPRTVTLRYGNAYPKNEDDIAFLKKLRESSRAAMCGIGWPESAHPTAQDGEG